MTSNRTAKKHPSRSSFDDQGEYMQDYEENDEQDFQQFSQITQFPNVQLFADGQPMAAPELPEEETEELDETEQTAPIHVCAECNKTYHCHLWEIKHGCCEDCVSFPECAVCTFLSMAESFNTGNYDDDREPEVNVFDEHEGWVYVPEPETEIEQPLEDGPSTIQNDPFWTSKPHFRICSFCDSPCQGFCKCEIMERVNDVSTPYDMPYHLCVDCNEIFECPEFEETSSCHCLPISAQCDSCEGKETMACWAHGTVSWEHGTWKPKTVTVVETEKSQLSVQADFITTDSPTPSPMAATETCKCLFGEECNSCAPRMSFPCLSCSIPIFCSAPMVCSDCV